MICGGADRRILQRHPQKQSRLHMIKIGCCDLFSEKEKISMQSIVYLPPQAVMRKLLGYGYLLQLE